MLVRVVGLAQSLLASNLILAKEASLSRRTSVDAEREITLVHVGPAEKSFLFLFGAFFEENFPQDIFFFLVRIVVFHIVVVRLVENTVRVMIAVWIFVSDPPGLTET